MQAGETIDIIAEWNWSDRSDVAKDWSIVAWGEQGELSVTHNDGLASDHMPFIERQEGKIDQGIYDFEGLVVPDEMEVEVEVIDMIQDGVSQDDPYCREAFTKWSESFNIVTTQDCGASIYEDGTLYDDGFRYQTVMLNTCKHMTKKYTIYMTLIEWFRIEHFYTTYTSEGEIIKDSIISRCVMHKEDEQILACTFELGYIENAADYGLSDPWQMRAAFQNKAGDYGMLWYDHEWVQSPAPAEALAEATA